MFYHMSILKESIKHMPIDIQRNDQDKLMFIHKLIVELLAHLDEEKKNRNYEKRLNAQPIVDEIDKVLKKYRLED